MRRWVSPLALVLGLVSGCSAAVAGEATPVKVVGVTQTATAGGLAVTLLAMVDPAPVYKDSEYAPEPDEGTRLAAARFTITNIGPEDRLIGPVGRVRFHGSDGKSYDDSLVATSAGAMLDQLRLAPRQTMIGYLTVELPGGVTVSSVDFVADYVGGDETLTWETEGQSVKEAPPLPARTGDGPKTWHAGEKATIEGESSGEKFRLTLAPTKVTDPAQTTDERIQVGPGARLLGVDFVVRNEGDTPYSDVESDADLRIFAVQNAGDEAITSHVYGASQDHGMPLMPGTDDTWHVLFVVPSDFEVDRVSFSPSFGSQVATVWTM